LGVATVEHVTPLLYRAEGRKPSAHAEREIAMGEFKKYLMTGLVVLIVIAVYNSLLKGFLPTSIRNMIGLS
jgi:hypothetical protein